MNSTKIKELIKFSFFTCFQNKWFVVFNILSLISMFFFFNWNNFVKEFNISFGDDHYDLLIQTSLDNIYESFSDSLKDSDIFTVKKFSENSYTDENMPKNVIVLKIEEDPLDFFKTTLISKEGIKQTYYNEIVSILKNERNTYLNEKYSLKNEDISFIQKDIKINRVLLSVDTRDSTTKELIKLLSSFFSYIVAIMLFSRIANEVSQEKSSKSSEYILTSVTGKEYLFSKVASNVAIMLVQFILMFSYFLISLTVHNLFNFELLDISLDTVNTYSNDLSMFEFLPYVAVLLILNIMSITLLSIVQATLAAKANNSSEAGNTVSIVVFIMMICYMMTLFLIEPASIVHPIIKAISIIPVISSYFIPALMIIGQSSTIEIIFAIVIELLLIPIAFNLCQKDFKDGLLNYSKAKKVKKKELSLKAQQLQYINKRTFSKIGMVVGLTIILYISLQQILGIIFSFLLKNADSLWGKGSNSLLVQSLTQIIGTLITYYFVRFYTTKKKTKSSYATKNNHKKLFTIKNMKIILMSYGVVSVFNIVVSYITSHFLNTNYDMTKLFDVTDNSSISLKTLLVLTVAIIPGIFEELLFRKALIDYSQKNGKVFAVILSALIFGLIHMNISQGIFAFGVGIIFGTIYIYTKDIRLSMIAHAMNNGMALIAVIVPESYTNIQFAILGIILILIIVGFMLFVKNLRNKKLPIFKVSFKKLKNNFSTKYKYLFYDFIFDISLLLIIIMSFFSEKTLSTIFK